MSDALFEDDDDFDAPAEHNRANMSAARASWMDEQGITGKNRRMVLNSIALSGDRGEAEREGERATGLTHQSYSGARTWLHEHGHIYRLTEKREHGAVYVTRLYVNDRATEPFKPNGRKRAEPVDLSWLKTLVTDLNHHLAHEGEPVDVHAVEGGWRDVIDYIPEEYR